MSTPKTATLLWIDLEMTGLDPARDRIVEVAAIATDWDLREIASFDSGVRQDPAFMQKTMTTDFHAARAEYTKTLQELAANSPSEAEVETKLCAFARRHFAPGVPILLAGNSIHQDRAFIRRWWPKFEKLLHYRMLDVSAWKVVMQGKYGVEFIKKEEHRALGDVRESMAELAFYLHKVNL